MGRALKLVDLLNIIVYHGPISVSGMMKRTGRRRSEVEKALKSLIKRRLVKKIDERTYDISDNLLSAIAQRKIREEDLMEIIGRRKPKYTKLLKLLGKLNELHHKILERTKITMLKFQRLPRRHELEMGEKPLEEAIADGLLTILTELIFNIPSTEPNEVRDIINEVGDEAKKSALEILEKFYSDVKRQYNLLKDILEKREK